MRALRTVPLTAHRTALVVAVATFGVSALGDGMLAFALALRSAEQDHPWATVLVFFAELIPAIVLGPMAGRALDAAGLRSLLVLGLALQTVLAGVVAVVGDLRIQIVLLALVAAAGAVTTTGSLVIVGRIGDVAGRQRSDSIASLVTSLAAVAAPAVGGVLFAVTKVEGVALIDAATFLGVAVAVPLVLPRWAVEPRTAVDQRPSVRERRTGPVAATRQGVRLLRNYPAVGRAMPLILIVIFATCLEGVAGVYYLRDVASGAPFVYGVMLGSWTIGAVCGSLVTADRLRRPPPVVLASAALVVGFGLCAAGAVADVPGVVIAFLIGGLGNGVFNTALRTVINDGIPVARRGLAWGTFRSLSSAAIGVGFILGAPGVLLPARAMVVASGVLAMLAAAAFMWVVLLPRVSRGRAVSR